MKKSMTMIYNKEIKTLQAEPTYSWGQVIVVSVIAVIVLYAIVRSAGHLFGSLRDSVIGDPLVQSAITVAQIARKLNY